MFVGSVAVPFGKIGQTGIWSHRRWPVPGMPAPGFRSPRNGEGGQLR
jgi:hypothetical protein